MRMLELFSGRGGGSSGFIARRHSCVTTDIGAQFHRDVTGDILDPRTLERIEALGPYEFVWASPPCDAFTVMNIGKNWNCDHTPRYEIAPHKLEQLIEKGADLDHERAKQRRRGDAATLGMRLLERTLEVIEILAPKAFVIENPCAKMRRMPQMRHLSVPDRKHGFVPPVTVTYCQYGDTSQKKTDLWCNPELLEFWTPRPVCKNGDPCHVAAPRGSRTPGSTQGKKGSADRALVPYELSLEVCLAVERLLWDGPRPRTGQGALL